MCIRASYVVAEIQGRERGPDFFKYLHLLLLPSLMYLFFNNSVDFLPDITGFSSNRGFHLKSSP